MGTYEENEKKVQTILERGVGILARNYGVRKLDAGGFSAPVTLNTQFRIAHYEIENVGHLMTMYTENNPQLLMATYTLTPYYKKLPLISSDFIFNGDGGMFLIEIYELVKTGKQPPFRHGSGSTRNASGIWRNLGTSRRSPASMTRSARFMCAKRGSPAGIRTLSIT